MERALGELSIIAEDLGLITEDVPSLLAQTGFSGMRVLIFGLLTGDNNLHLSCHYPEDMVAYTSAHGSETICQMICETLPLLKLI